MAGWVVWGEAWEVSNGGDHGWSGLLHGAVVVEAVYVEVFLPGVVDVVSSFLTLVDEENGGFP